LSARYFEDFAIGDVIESVDDYEITPARLHDFAAAFDPQPIHLDEDSARSGFFGEIVASGWQTLTVTMRQLVLSPLFSSGSVIGVGIEHLRWLTPVKPGDRLTARAEVLATDPSRSRVDMGYLSLRVTTHNQEGEIVAMQEWRVLVPRRPE
jgi:acyl dehydratase